MVQNNIVTESGENRSAVNFALLISSAIANFIAITGFLAILIKRDPILIFFITLAAAVLAALVYRARRSQYLMSRARLVVILAITIVSVVLAIITWSFLANRALTPVKVTITDPPNGGNVTLQYLVKGAVSDPNATAYVIVHPFRVSQMWVQQIPIVDGEGNWQASCVFGTEMLGISERYEVIALATGDNFLINWATGNRFSEGDILTGLPHKSNKSALITVIRPK